VIAAPWLWSLRCGEDLIAETEGAMPRTDKWIAIGGCPVSVENEGLNACLTMPRPVFAVRDVLKAQMTVMNIQLQILVFADELSMKACLNILIAT
jgi:hypothetical protein